MNIILLVLALSLAPQISRTTIEGVVVDAATSRPLAEAQVGLTAVVSRDSATPRPLPSVTSDAEGKFRIEVASAGLYRLWASHNNYARREVGSAISGNSGQQTGTVLNIAEGQSIHDVTVGLVRSGSVSGRVLSTSGDPAIGLQVALVRARYNEAGVQFLETEASGWTNDRGEYRLSGVGPGSYSLLARSQTVPAFVRQNFGQAAPEAGAGKFAATYLGGSSNPANARQLEVKEGANIAGTDLILPRSDGYNIRGSVIDESTGQPPVAIGFSLLPRPLIGPLDLVSFFGPGYKRDDGTFEVRIGPQEETFPPGAYWLVLTRPTAVDRPTARVPIDVVNSNLDNIQAVLRRPVELKGKVTLDGGSSTGLSISLFPRIEPRWPAQFGLPQSAPAIVASNGTFLFPKVYPDVYDVLVHGLPRGVFVKEMRFGETDVLGNELNLSGPTADSLNVVLSLQGATVEGLLRDRNSAPFAFRQVVLIPDQARSRSDLYRVGSTDGRGAFLIEGIAPGAYKLFAWENAEPFAYFDPAFIARFENQGKAVAATESSRHNVEIVVLENPER